MPAASTRFWYESEGGGRLSIEVVPALTGPEALERVAALCAEHYHRFASGWEAPWPRPFTIYASEEAAVPLGTFTVDRQMRPYFVARRA